MEVYIKENSFLPLIEVNNRLFLPYNIRLNILVTSADVLHSFSVPSLGLKIDCCPGRLNRVKFESFSPGIAFGQCTEICGANHRFIPFILNFINAKDFISLKI